MTSFTINVISSWMRAAMPDIEVAPCLRNLAVGSRCLSGYGRILAQCAPEPAIRPELRVWSEVLSMFEDSLMESRNRLVSKSRRWITVGSVGLQCLIAGAIVMVPLVRPEALAFRSIAPVVVVPALKKPPVVVEQVRPVARQSSAASLPVIQTATRAAMLPSLHPSDPELAMGDPPPVTIGSMTSGPGTGTEIFGPSTGTGLNVTVAPPKKTGPVRVSSGISAGLLLTEIKPVYPRIAVAARQEGTVMIEATISKTGAIESAHVLSGPAMLQGAAIEAVKLARYKPYRLNGEATEVQTTVTVVFRLGS
ncbi:energy transducer TonB [Granulicella sibirica]|uniref:Ferric siderophore transport system, periplasmic binding protein TonB n=1 Tax=Granulicella sibirica TaxID=2479048 RepID=A0A4Q0SXZ7_9BACT|nr:energy transducer TonB [Granulicella sibirica]RXH56025.1 Ferric siderophore transport system, periplasmic binding protein TonB [Granulicella sibirica]